MARYSSNADASKATQWVGFDKIAQTLTSTKYRFYDPHEERRTVARERLTVDLATIGKATRCTIFRMARTTLQLARFFTMLAEDKFVDPEHSRLMKEVLSKPGINHKFVKGLSGVPGITIYRKSGTWRDWHSDAALIEWNGHRYVLAALTEDHDGGKLLEKLAAGAHEIVCHSASRKSWIAFSIRSAILWCSRPS